MAKGYWVACVNVKNQDEFKKYVNLAGPTINLHGGKFLVRGNNVYNIEGIPTYHSCVHKDTLTRCMRRSRRCSQNDPGTSFSFTVSRRRRSPV